MDKEINDIPNILSILNNLQNMNCEEIILAHNMFIGKKDVINVYNGDLGKYFLFKVINYDCGFSVVKENTAELIKFFNSKYFSDYFKEMLIEGIENSHKAIQILARENNIADFSEDEFYTIYEALKNNGKHELLLAIALKLDSDGAIKFLNNKVHPLNVIKRIVKTSGLCDRPEYYSGRGAKECDLNAKMLIAIYNKLVRLDQDKALNMARMTFNMPTLGATEFIHTLYKLALNNYDIEKINLSASNISLGNTREEQLKVLGMAIFASLLNDHDEDETLFIKIKFKNLLLAHGIKDIWRKEESIIRCR